MVATVYNKNTRSLGLCQGEGKENAVGGGRMYKLRFNFNKFEI